MKKAFCKANDEGRVLSISYDFHCGDGEIIVDVPDEVDIFAEGQVLTVVDGVVSAAPAEEDSKVDEVTLLKAQVEALTERGDFVEDCIAEMAMQVYG